MLSELPMVSPLLLLRRPMRVGVLGLGGLGGSGRVAHDVACGLAQRGHRVVVLTAPEAVFIGELGPGVQHHPVAAPTTPQAADAAWVARLADDLYSAVLRHDLQVLSVHYGIGLADAAIAARERLAHQGRSVRVVVTLHGTDISHLTVDSAQRAGLRKALLSADAVTAVSPSLARSATLRLNLRRSPLVIANGVDTQVFRPSRRLRRARVRPANEPWVLCHASNFRPVKRPLDCIDVLASLLALGTPARLEMIGDGPLRSAAEDYARSMGVAEAVRFVGPLPQHTLAGHLRRADVALVTSASESFGLVALESMASGTVLTGWRCEGLTDLLGADPALAQQLLAPLGDFAALTGHLQSMLLDERAYDDARRRCLHIGRTQYRRDSQVERYEELLTPLTHREHTSWAADART